MALTAAPSAPFLSPRPTQRAPAIDAASVTRASSRARLRSGASCSGSGSGSTAEFGPTESLAVIGAAPFKIGFSADAMQLPHRRSLVT